MSNDDFIPKKFYYINRGFTFVDPRTKQVVECKAGETIVRVAEFNPPQGLKEALADGRAVEVFRDE